MLYIVVGMTRPEEAAKTVLVVAWDDMHVQVGHALAYLVVHRDKCALCFHRLLYGSSKTLDPAKERSYCILLELR